MAWERVENQDILSYAMYDLEIKCPCGHEIKENDVEDWLGPNFDTITCPQCSRRYEIRLDLYVAAESVPSGQA